LLSQDRSDLNGDYATSYGIYLIRHKGTFQNKITDKWTGAVDHNDIYKTTFVTKLCYFVYRACQYIYLNINQLDALNFIMSLFHASTRFEHMCASSGGQNCSLNLCTGRPPIGVTIPEAV